MISYQDLGDVWEVKAGTRKFEEGALVYARRDCWPPGAEQHCADANGVPLWPALPCYCNGRQGRARGALNLLKFERTCSWRVACPQNSLTGDVCPQAFPWQQWYEVWIKKPSSTVKRLAVSRQWDASHQLNQDSNEAEHSADSAWAKPPLRGSWYHAIILFIERRLTSQKMRGIALFEIS